MTTARDIISLSLFDTGIFGTGMTPAGADTNNALIRLNEMISQWQRQRWLVYVLTDNALAMTGAQSYTIGTGGQFNVARPDRLEAAYIRQVTPAAPNQPDYPLELIQSREAYSNIVLKQLGSFPRYIFYESSFPLGNVFPWPLPSSLYSLHLILKGVLQTFATLDTVYAMPEEYKAALRWNLCKVLMLAYRIPEDEGINKQAASSLNIIRNANAQLPTLRMPPELVRPSLYNVFSDQSY